MVESAVAPNATLAEVLRARAGRTPADRLVLDVVGGLLIIAVAVWAQPAGWVVIVSAAACFASYGSWAIAEKHLAPTTIEAAPVPSNGWAVVHAIASILGV